MKQLFIYSILCLSLAACGGKKNNVAEPQETPAADSIVEEKIVALPPLEEAVKLPSSIVKLPLEISPLLFPEMVISPPVATVTLSLEMSSSVIVSLELIVQSSAQTFVAEKAATSAVVINKDFFIRLNILVN